MSDDDGYLLDNKEAAAGPRLEALAAIFDPVTFRHIDALGITGGWHCWEVGAGGPSVLRWLARRSAPGGRVLGTDIDVSWLSALTRGDGGAAGFPGDPDGADIEVRRHDVAGDDAPDERFDLVHARLVLVHVPERDAVLASMVATLRPGGWLLVEDADPSLQPLSCIDPRTEDEELANTLRSGFRTLMADRGAELAYGRRLPRLLRQAGLHDVAADASFPVVHPLCARLEITTIELIRRTLVDNAIATEEEVDRHLANVAAGRVEVTQPPMISAWGRAPLR